MTPILTSALRASLATLAIATCAVALADEGHNHDHGPAAPQGEASPRFEAHSDLFEMVGVAENGQVTLYLDRYASNEPVTGATIEFESGAHKGVAAAQPDGTYLVKLPGLDKPGHFPLSFTVTAGRDTDLLAGELEIGDPHAHEEEAAHPWASWGRWAAIATAVLAALAIALAAVRRKSSRAQA